MAQCPLCNSTDVKAEGTIATAITVECKGCGNYSLTGSADAILNDHAKALKLASWVYTQNAIGVTPRIDGNVMSQVDSIVRPDVTRRAELYLRQAIRSLNGELSGMIDMNDSRLQIASWSTSDNDATALAAYWHGMGAMMPSASPRHTRVLVNAHMIYDELTGRRAASSQAFVAMSFAEDLKAAYDIGLGPAIEGAGYEPLRVDRKEHEGKIDDTIIAEIRRSAFVVADLTGHRGGVYYEAGFAHGLDRRVIFCCREDDHAKAHFDIRQYNTLLWKEPGDLLKPLQNRILALFGAGPKNPNARPL